MAMIAVNFLMAEILLLLGEMSRKGFIESS